MIDAPPGEPTARNGLPWRVTIVGAIELRGRLRAVGAVGVVGGVVVEVGQLVVEQEAVAGHDDAVAAGRLDRERVGHDGAVAVRDHEVGGRVDASGSDRAGSTGLVAACSGSISARRSRGEARREQAAQRHVEEGRVGQERVAVREREARRLEEQVQRARPVGAEVGIALEDVERLADRRAAARRRAHAPDVEAAVANVGGPALEGVVGGDVASWSAGPGRQAWSASGAIGGRRAASTIAGRGRRVEARALRRRRSGGRCGRGRGCAARRRRRAACRRRRGRARRRGDVVEPGDVLLGLRHERVVDGEAAPATLMPGRSTRRSDPVP